MMFVFMVIEVTLLLFCNPSCCTEDDLQRIFKDGDIVIGGLFPIHNQVNNSISPPSKTCDSNSYDIEVLFQSQAMIYAIEQINNSSLLSELQIGYEMYDTCADVTLALNATLRLLEGEALDKKDCIASKGSYANNTAKAVIGESSSEVSVAVARLLSLPHMTQISYASTSELLSSKVKFPSFFRTVPSDKHQVEAIVQLVKEFNFVPVGIISSDDEYGKYGAESLADYFKQSNVCLDFKEILPADFSEKPSMLYKLQNILNSSLAEAIVLFTKESIANAILKEAIMIGKKRTWIGSDAWSTSKKILHLPNLSNSGRILGVTCKRIKVPGFVEYVEQLIIQNSTRDSFLHNFLSKNPPCPRTEDQNCSLFASNPVNKSDGNCIRKTCLLDFIKQDESYGHYTIYMAVNIIAQAIKRLLQSNNDTHFPAWKLTEQINQVNFSMDNTTYIFLNENGELNIGYDILEWKTNGSVMNISTIGKYEQNDTKLESGVIQENNTKMETQFHCFKSCKPGFELVSENNSCCKKCQHCKPNTFSNGGDHKCEQCNDSNNSQCLKEFLEWKDGFSITLATFATIGLVITLTVAVLFVKCCHTPVVRAAGGYLCFPALLSLLGCFTSVFLFLGEPTNASCMAGLPLFGLSYTVCVSCILANLLQIFVGFAFNIKYGDWLKWINQPAMVMMTCSCVQMVVCALWLILYPPFREEHATNTDFLLCNKGSKEFFVAMLVYIALLCMVCFLFAYKGRRLPDLYKNASFIKIGMLIYLVVWILFIPIYMHQHAKYERATEAMAIMVSSYSILVCHFAPKCYILIWKKQLNDENTIVEYIRKHCESKGIRVVT